MKFSDMARSGVMELPLYVAGKPVEQVRRELGLTNIIKMASNENPLGASPRALEAIRGSLDNLHQYPEGHSPALRSALAEFFGLDPACLIVSNGSDNIISLACLAFVGFGDEAVIGYPTFSVYEHGTLLTGGRPVFVPLEGNRFDLEGMLAAITSRTKLVFICNPNNPTGTIVGHRELESFLDRVPQGVLVIIDEAYAEYVQAADYPRSAGFICEGRNIIVLRTFSKIFGIAGLRVGYGMAPPEVISILERVREPFPVNRLGQAAALAALHDRDHVQKSLKVNNEGKAFLERALVERGISFVPTQANFILINVGRPSATVVEGLLRRGFIVRSGAPWGLDDCIRVTIGLPQENEGFVHALDEVLGDVPRA